MSSITIPVIEWGDLKGTKVEYMEDILECLHQA